MKSHIPFWLAWVFFATGCVLGLYYGWTLPGEFTPPPCPECSEVDTDAQMILLMDECDRCKNKEAKNWEDAARKRRDKLEECLDLKRIYEAQNMKWAYSLCTLRGKVTCGPLEWTCEEATRAAAIAERAYNECNYGGYFPGYTMLDGWLDDSRESREAGK